MFAADFGFSQEFAEYRAYSEGDDPRLIDWCLRSHRADLYPSLRRRDQYASDGAAAMRAHRWVTSRGALASSSSRKFLAAALAYHGLATARSRRVSSCSTRRYETFRPATSRRGQPDRHDPLDRRRDSRQRHQSQSPAYGASANICRVVGLVASDFGSKVQARR